MIQDLQHRAQNLAKDPETDFIVVQDHFPTRIVNGVSSSISFQPIKKLEFLSKLMETWPNDGAALAHVSISFKTYDYHRTIDPVFNDAVEQVNRFKVAELEGTMWKFAQTKVGAFMDRVALGRIYARDKFDPGARIEVTHKKEDRDDMKKRWDRLGHVVDAEVVAAVTRTLAQGSGGRSPETGALAQGSASEVQGKPTP